MRQWGEAPYRARQLYQGLYQGLATRPEELTTLPRKLRDRIATELEWGTLRMVRTQSGDQGLTRKALFVTPENAPVESVLMLYERRATVCVSTQSGCAMGCPFCATGRMGFRMNLSAGQMIEQVLWAAREARSGAQSERPLTNVVYMGMGEPFHNYDAWWSSVERLHDPEGFNLGARNFTVSTVGLVPGIRRLSQAPLPINLAVSLHAAEDSLRSELVPVNRKYPLAKLMEALRDYARKTGRRVSFEYVLMEDVNDAVKHAVALARLLKREGPPLELCHVNLIPWNPVAGAPLSPSNRERARRFRAALQARGVPCTIRLQRGVGIDAACGQLSGGVKTA